MNLKNLFSRHIQVADGVTVPVSRHFYYSTFGVCGRHDNIVRTGNYVCSGTPGSGFFFRKCDSHSYHVFVRAQRRNLKQSMKTLLLGREPNFEKEMHRTEQALKTVTDKESQRILSVYYNVLMLAKEEELLQRIVRGIKDKMGHGNKSMYTSILAHYKSSIATLEHDVAAAQHNIKNDLNETQMEAWTNLVNAFNEMGDSRRIWSVFIEDGKEWYQQVFFDLGIFDYIQSPVDTPIIRDHNNLHYYLYPEGILRARTSTDFDFFRWKDIHVTYNPMDINTLAVRPEFTSHLTKRSKGNRQDALTALYGYTHGSMVGELLIPEMNLRFFVNHTEPVEAFVRAISAFVDTK